MLNPDGTMDTTWKLRPNEKWHDGTPFTAEDLVFSLNAYKDHQRFRSTRARFRAPTPAF